MSDTKKKPLEFEAKPEAPTTPPLVAAPAYATNGAASTLKRSYFEDDVITDDVYTTVIRLGDVDFYAREFTRDELKAFRSAAMGKLSELGIDPNVLYDAAALTQTLAELPPDAAGNNGIDQYSMKMSETFAAVIEKHLRGWAFPWPCTSEKKAKLWPSNKYEFCNALSQLGELSPREAAELKNS